MSSKVAAILLILFLGACQPAVVKPTPARQTIHAAFTPTLGWIGPLMNNCSRVYPVDVTIKEVPISQLAGANADIIFSWGSIPVGEGAAYEMGKESLVVIVHPENPLLQISLAQLRGIYDQSIQSWGELDGSQSNLGTIERWSFPELQDTRQVIGTILSIRDGGFSPLWLAPDPHAMRQAVASNPLAMGYLPHRWLDGSIKEIPVMDENQNIFRIEQPVFMVQAAGTQINPDWSVCVRQGITASQ